MLLCTSNFKQVQWGEVNLWYKIMQLSGIRPNMPQCAVGIESGTHGLVVQHTTTELTTPTLSLYELQILTWSLGAVHFSWRQSHHLFSFLKYVCLAEGQKVAFERAREHLCALSGQCLVIWVVCPRPTMASNQLFAKKRPIFALFGTMCLVYISKGYICKYIQF